MGIAFLIGGYYVMNYALMGFGILAIVIGFGIYCYEENKGEIDE